MEQHEILKLVHGADLVADFDIVFFIAQFQRTGGGRKVLRVQHGADHFRGDQRFQIGFGLGGFFGVGQIAELFGDLRAAFGQFRLAAAHLSRQRGAACFQFGDLFIQRRDVTTAAAGAAFRRRQLGAGRCEIRFQLSELRFLFFGAFGFLFQGGNFRFQLSDFISQSLDLAVLRRFLGAGLGQLLIEGAKLSVDGGGLVQQRGRPLCRGVVQFRVGGFQRRAGFGVVPVDGGKDLFIDFGQLARVDSDLHLLADDALYRHIGNAVDALEIGHQFFFHKFGNTGGFFTFHIDGGDDHRHGIGIDLADRGRGNTASPFGAKRLKNFAHFRHNGIHIGRGIEFHRNDGAPLSGNGADAFYFSHTGKGLFDGFGHGAFHFFRGGVGVIGNDNGVRIIHIGKEIGTDTEKRDGAQDHDDDHSDDHGIGFFYAQICKHHLYQRISHENREKSPDLLSFKPFYP